jgi:preprotein translocase subunit SecA
MLKMRGINHQVLNAKQHQREAEIVAEAGKPSTVTIATNMAGRGTDIKLAPESKASGGLAIIGTERHESRRVDRQLRGRAGRQGDPGSSQFFVSLEDNLMRLFGSDRIARLMDRMGLEEGEVIQHSMISSSIERAQKKVEENNFGTRKRLLEYDDVMNAQREVVYKRRRNALHGERLELDIWNMIFDASEDMILNHKITNDFENFELNVIRVFGFDTKITASELSGKPAEELTQKLYNEALEHYLTKNAHIQEHSFPIITDIHINSGPHIQNIAVPFSDGKKHISVVASLEKAFNSRSKELIKAMEKVVVLTTIDQAWTQHLREMDDLKQSVQNAVYEQKDPLLVYKFESFELFKRMIGKVNEESVAFLSRADIPVEQQQEVQEAPEPVRAPQPKLKMEHESGLDSLGAGPEDLPNHGIPGMPPLPQQEAPKQAPVRSVKVANRNDKVSVQYADGRVLRDVKYKSVEDDVLNHRCVLIED